MALIRLQNKVPNIYVDESRDFQLFCRLYDIIFNNIKYDVDGVERLINSHDCKSNILQLLQTKLGFYTNKRFTDDALRAILECFPVLVKGKGSRIAIERAVYLYLKTVGIETEIKVDVIETNPTQAQKRLYGSNVTDHCVVIGIESTVQDLTSLKEILKYIIPFGYNVFFYFFVGQSVDDITLHSESARLILVSDDVNSSVGGSTVLNEKNINPLYWDVEKQKREPRLEQHWNPETMRYDIYDVDNELINTINTIEAIPVETDFEGKPAINEINIVSEEVDFGD